MSDLPAQGVEPAVPDLPLDFDPEFQRRILTLAFRDSDYCAFVSGVMTGKLFSSRPLGVVFDIIADYHRRYHTPPTLEVVRNEVARAFNGRRLNRDEDMAEVGEIGKALKSEVPDEAYIRDQTTRFAQHQAVIKATIEIPGILRSGRYDKALDLMKRAVETGVQLNQGGTWYFADSEKRLEQQYGAEAPPSCIIPTGIDPIDDCLLRFGMDKNIVVVGGPSNRGKTTMIRQILFEAVLRGFPAVAYTFEENTNAFARGLDVMFSGITAREIPQRYREVLDGIYNTMETRKCLVDGLYIQHMRAPTVSKIRAHLSWLASRGLRPKLIILNQFNDLRGEVQRQKRVEELNDVALEIQALRDETGASIVIGAQTTRESYEKEIITMADLAEAMGIIHVSDIDIFLCQSRAERNESPVALRLNLDKNREGKSGLMFKVRADFSRHLIYDRDATLTHEGYQHA